ncbi:MAG: valine--pyruvate transaminase, partial [Sphaerochaetaceae bacterium]
GTMPSMELSDFGSKLTSRSGILSLMDDLGKPLPKGVTPYPLGGGNPARIPQVEAAYRREMEALLADGDAFENVIAHYDAPQGRMRFVEQVSSYLSHTYGWKIGPENVAVLNGSQSAMFDLFNLFSGSFTRDRHTWKKTVLFPLMPEYVGYADQGIEPDTFVSLPSRCTYLGEHTFKYAIDFPLVEEYLEAHTNEGEDGQVGAICVTRPTNPSGNVLTDQEIHHLSDLAHAHGIPLLVDNAYGLPFPDIVFIDHAEPIWNQDIILSMSLSKIGLPAIRTGIVVARKEIITALSNINAIVSLTSGSMGQVLAGSLIESGKLVELAKHAVQPYYQKRARQTQQWIETFFAGTDYAYHKMEGSIFCWLYLPRLSLPTCQFYEVLKQQGVITVPGEYSFFGHPDQKEGKPYPHPHFTKCLRLNYSAPEEKVETGLRIIAEQYRKYGG